MSNEVEKTIKIYFSNQAEEFLKHMPDVSRTELISWFITKRKIYISGGDIHDFLKNNGDK